MCSFSFLVISPMVPNTETFINAKHTPVIMNNSFIAMKVPTDGIIKHVIVINPSDSSIDFLYPILAIKEATRKDVTAILKSLHGSNTEAETSST